MNQLSKCMRKGNGMRCLFAVYLMLCATPALSATITGGTAPGGFVLADGSSSLKLWLKADAITSVTPDTTFSNWVDSSNTAGVTTGSLGTDPTYRASTPGLNPAAGYTASVEFIGGNALSLSGLTSLLTGSVFAVAAPQNDRYVLQHQLNRQLRLRQSNGQNISAYNGANNPVSTATTTTAGNYFIAEWLGNTSSISFYENGAARGTGLLTGGPTGLSDVGYNRVGLQGGSAATVNISEIVVFNVLLNSAERQIVENALSAKWNLPMLANNLYSGDTLPGDYDRDVFGIGRVDVNNQVTSAGSAGFGIEATGSLDNTEFVLAGHNVASNGITSAGLGPSAERWLRHWYVEETGDVDVDFAFDWSDAGLGAPDIVFDQLYFSADGVNFTNMGLTGTYAGDTVIFSLTADQLITGFYTLGSPTIAPEPSSLVAGVVGLGLLLVRKRRRD